MPVIQVFAEPVEHRDAKLGELCEIVCRALELAPGSVVATFLTVEATVVPGSDQQHWPVVILHGTARPVKQMARAREDVEAAVSTWHGEGGSAWVTWQLRT